MGGRGKGKSCPGERGSGLSAVLAGSASANPGSQSQPLLSEPGLRVKNDQPLHSDAAQPFEPPCLAEGEWGYRQACGDGFAVRWKRPSPRLTQRHEALRGPEVARAPHRCIPAGQLSLSLIHLLIHSLNKQARDCFRLLTSELIILSFERVTEELGD